MAANSAVALNTSKVSFTDALVALAPSVVLNTAKIGHTSALVAATAAVQANTSKVGFTDALVALAPSVVLNSAKTGYTEALVAANSAVALNTAKTGYTEALVAANSAVALNTAKRADSAVDTLLAAKSDLASPTFTGTVVAPLVHSAHIRSTTGHLKLQSSGTDINLHIADTECLQITRSGTECRFTVSGGSGVLRAMGAFAVNGTVNFSGLPTSASGLSTGDLWNNSGVLTIA